MAHSSRSRSFTRRFQILVVDFLLLVGHIEKALWGAVELLALVLVAELLQAVLQAACPLRAVSTIWLWPTLGRIDDDLIGIASSARRLVDARTGRRRCAHDGLVGLHVHAGDGADQAARLDELAGVDVGVRIRLLAVRAWPRPLPPWPCCRALAEAVDGALDLRGPLRRRPATAPAVAPEVVCGSAPIR